MLFFERIQIIYHFHVFQVQKPVKKISVSKHFVSIIQIVAMEPERKRQKRDVDSTILEDLPNEIILKILSHMDIIGLYQCMAVNKKIRAIANDESLWKKFHLSGKIPAEVLKQIINKGCQYLSLYQCIIPRCDVKFKKNFTLRYLSVYYSVEEPNENFDVIFVIFFKNL